MTARAIPRTSPRRRRILYIESDAGSRDLAATLIGARKGLVLLHAADMDVAMHLPRRERPEVVLVNADQPGLDAAHIMKLLRANPATKSAPVIALGTGTTPTAVIKGLEAGFFLYLAKPIQSEPFMEAIDWALEFAAVERAELNPLKEPR